jgi:hypothetical protein
MSEELAQKIICDKIILLRTLVGRTPKYWTPEYCVTFVDRFSLSAFLFRCPVGDKA